MSEQGENVEGGGPTGLKGLDHAGVAFHPPVMLAAALAAGLLLKQLVPLRFLPDAFPEVLGPLLVAASFGLFLWAVATMSAANASIPTNTSTEVIVTGGPYRFSRNPIYVAMVLLQVGVGLWADSVWFLLLAAVSVGLLYVGVIAREEKYLEAKFGSTYTSYKAHVRRWL